MCLQVQCMVLPMWLSVIITYSLQADQSSDHLQELLGQGHASIAGLWHPIATGCPLNSGQQTASCP